jgi:hypothetical protein
LQKLPAQFVPGAFLRSDTFFAWKIANLTEANPTDIELPSLKETLDRWQNDFVDKVAVADLLSRCPVAHKWKAPYRCLVVREALLRRMVDLGSAIDALTDQGQVLGTRILLRCAVETTALLEFMAQKIDDVVAGKLAWFDFDTETMKILVGSRSSTSPNKFEAFSIVTAVKRANRAYGALDNIHEKLSESVHPNYDGVIYAYSRPAPEDHETRFGNFWIENFGHEHLPGTAYVFACFADAYNVHWIEAMSALEQWLRDNDEDLEAKRQSIQDTPPAKP